MNIKQVIENFKINSFNEASRAFFQYLNVPLNNIIEDEIDISTLFGENKNFNIIDSTFLIGGIDDKIFENKNNKLELKSKRYDSLLIFAINLNIINPSRSELSKISRVFNRNFEYTPVVILFKYGNKLSLSSTERQEYQTNQKWRDGEKIGKVSILRDIEIDNLHRGHLDILEEMKLPNSISTYEELYSYWQKVFDVSLLNKKFYRELQHWYLYAIHEVTFPNEPQRTEYNYSERLKREYLSKNVIRLLTRLLFVWFIKEKGLIPNDLFEEDKIKNILKEFDPKKIEEDTLFAGQDKRSFYYKAILQNLFFATLNQEMGKRKFREYNHHKFTFNLMRYKEYFKNPNEFITLVEGIVPFMNGGLFECLDTPHPSKKDKRGNPFIQYEDSFSDSQKELALVVPDFLFFGQEEIVDLSIEYGSKNSSFKNASVKGLINILKSYKFTVAENTPIEEDVALDPELLGKVFENLLASYNPETKMTARKQTGSFYTPRQIVSYMVDESLIDYLKGKLVNNKDDESLSKKLHKLLDYSDTQPFEDENEVLEIINAIDSIKILDPAVGSGAFPMGALQKMVHILHKLDPENKHWFNLQLEKAKKETDEVFKNKDRNEREHKLKEINDAFDIDINHPDYARKLFLIENTIFGVDVQPIAIQISKLRFFISLVVEQNINNTKENFGIRPLPNLESKFVTANTLLDVEKVKDTVFEEIEIKELEDHLKKVRHKIFNAKTPQTKKKLRELDQKLRNEISIKLTEHGIPSGIAKQLANWDPYDQNISSSFFNTEWMFGIKSEFDIVIGNPPYIDSESMVKSMPLFRDELKSKYNTAKGNWDIFVVFIEKSISLAKTDGCISLIVPNKLISAKYTQALRSFMNKYNIVELIDYSYVNVFREADVYPIVFRIHKNIENSYVTTKVMSSLEDYKSINKIDKNIFSKDIFWDKYFFDKDIINLILHISSFRDIASSGFNVLGAATVNEAYKIKEVIVELDENQENYLKFVNTGTIDPFETLWDTKSTQYIKGKYEKPIVNIESLKKINEVRFEQSISPKIIIAGMAIKIEAFYDKGDFLAGKSTTIILGKEIYLKSLTAILNSTTSSFWFSKYYNSLSMAGGYLNMGRNEISSIPIPDLSKIDLNLFNTMVDCLDFLINTKSIFDNVDVIINNFKQIINAIVFELYFEKHMLDKNIHVIELFQLEISTILKNEEFESLDSNKKHEIILQIHKSLTHPDNKVRNRIKLFAVRSPNILKPILEHS